MRDQALNAREGAGTVRKTVAGEDFIPSECMSAGSGYDKKPVPSLLRRLVRHGVDSVPEASDDDLVE